MTTDPTPRARRRAVPAFVLLWALGASAAAVSVAWQLWPAPDGGEPPGPGAGTPPGMDLPIDAPGIERPAALPAADAAALADSEPVVGISAGGRHRAYLVRALAKDPQSHIVNDVLAGVPVSVTHCNVFHCTRVFTAATPGRPLEIAQGGLTAGGMVLKLGRHTYRQDSGAPLDRAAPPFPYAAYPGEETTWGAWWRGHPDTDVYVGDVSLSPPAAEESPSVRVAKSPPPVPAEPGVLSRAVDFLAPLVYYGAAPLLIGLATLLAHALLALAVRPRRARAATETAAAPPAPPPPPTPG